MQRDSTLSNKSPEKQTGETHSRRNFLAKILMGIGLLFSYGLLTVEGFLFMLPKRVKARTRKLFAGKLDQYKIGSIQAFYDLEGKQILIKRDESGLKAFSSVCPHLGCRVHWEGEKHRFFCPCHGGVFTEDGVAIAGPPADAGQSLFKVPVHVDEASGIVYIEVKDAKRRTMS